MLKKENSAGRIKTIEGEVAKKALAIAQEELRLTEPLLAKGDVSKTDVLRLQRQVADLSAQIVNRRNSYARDVMAELSRNEEELMLVEQTLVQRKNLLDRTDVKSPSAGLVKNIRVTTLAGVLRQGEELMQITPNQNDLLIEARVKPSDIGFVKVGLPAAVKIDAFDYTVYGTLPGLISYVSSDSVRDETPKAEEFFRVHVRVEQQNLKEKLNGPAHIQAGMSAVVEIKTGTHSVLSYLTKPVTKTLSESLHER
jgi:adhesin transport system membrane fusion protein